MRKSHGSKGELDWVIHYDRSWIDQCEVLDDCCHVNSVLVAFSLDITLLQLLLFLDISSAERGSYVLKKTLKMNSE